MKILARFGRAAAADQFGIQEKPFGGVTGQAGAWDEGAVALTAMDGTQASVQETFVPVPVSPASSTDSLAEGLG